MTKYDMIVTYVVDNRYIFEYMINIPEIKVKEYFGINGRYDVVTKNEILCKDDYQCMICRLEECDGMLMLSCNHIFHIKCLMRWFDKIGRPSELICLYCNKIIDWKNVKKVKK